MAMITRLTPATVILLGGVTVAAAQTTEDHNAHHPDAPAPTAAPATPTPAPGAAGTMPMTDMSKMAGGDIGQMMSMMPAMMRMMRGAMMSHGDGMGAMPFDHIEGRIAFYKTELGITDAQLVQWNAFADALRAGATGMRTAMGTMMQSGMPAAAPARIDALVQILSARLDAMKAMAMAGKALYAVLTDEQKKIADDLMAQPMGRM